MAASRDFGIYGYKGVILPKHIVRIKVPKVEEVQRRVDNKFFRQQFLSDDFISISKDELSNYINTINKIIK